MKIETDNLIMFPSSKNFLDEGALSKQLEFARKTYNNLNSIKGTEHAYGWIENEMFELHLEIINLEVELERLRNGLNIKEEV